MIRKIKTRKCTSCRYLFDRKDMFPKFLTCRSGIRKRIVDGWMCKNCAPFPNLKSYQVDYNWYADEVNMNNYIVIDKNKYWDIQRKLDRLSRYEDKASEGE